MNGEGSSYEALVTELGEPIFANFESPNAFNEGPFCLTEGTSDLGANSDSITRTSFPASPSLLVYDRRLSGFWSGSPIKLLNSSFTANLVGASLDDTYRSMIYGMESRYLAYACNPFASSHNYCFSEENQHMSPSELGTQSLAPQAPRDPNASNHALQSFSNTPNPSVLFDFFNLPGSPKISEQEVTKVTFVGLARFLDHFSNLYGNKLDRQTRKENEYALVAAQQAFALQWSPCDTLRTKSSISASTHQKYPLTNNSQIFAASWFSVRSRILDIKPHRSFTLIYAMLLFHMTSAPGEAKDATTEKNHVLGQCLHQLLGLKDLVEGYCKHLGRTSTYRMLLESSLKVFQWFAYIKDTMASIVSDRDCILPDASVEPTRKHLPSIPR